MLPYFVMVGVPAILSLLFIWAKVETKKANQIVIDAFFAIWLILLLFRSESIGVDLPVYKMHFRNYAFFTWKEIFNGILEGEFEAGFVVISKLLSYITNDFRWMIIVCACISVIPVWILYRNEGKLGFFAIAMFINIAPFAMYFSGLRQAMAMAFVIPCYYFCRDKKLLKYLLMIFFAFLFHRSAMILIFLYPIYHLRLKKQYHLLYLIPIIGGIYVFRTPLFRFLINFVGDYADEYGDGIQETGAFAVTLLLTALLVYAFIIADPEIIDYDTIGLRNVMILSAVLQVFSGVHSIAMRMNYYYLLLIPIAMVKIVQNGNKKYRDIIYLSLICMTLFFTIYYFYFIYTDLDILNIYPYESFLK